MRMSASMCLVLMEMTGAPNILPFLMMVLIISKGVGDRFNYRWAGRCRNGSLHPAHHPATDCHT
jgi:H+/Cl- antiporter ClcA